jgi:hypothetical protein
MRFDTARAIEWAGRFAFPREAGTDGERRAAEVVAGELGRLGLQVDQVAVQGSRLPALAEPWLGWVGLAAWSTALALATYKGAAWPLRLALAIGASAWLYLTAVGSLRLAWAWPRRVATTNVVAWRMVEPSPQVRVVFHTTLDAFDPGRSLVPPWLATNVIALLLAGQIFVALTARRDSSGLPAWSGLLLLGLLWLAIGGRVWRLAGRGGRADLRDNRTGLAVLLELARTWPRGTHARIETRFVATGGRALDRAGLHALARAIACEWPARPTLVVDWLAPGIGTGLALMEEGTAQLAVSAAEDLWIPHHVIHLAGVRRELWPFGRKGPGYVGMVGDAIDKPADPAQGIDPDALARAAQLATEVALRWARKEQARVEKR